MNQQDFDRAGGEFVRILSKLENADLQALASCFGIHKPVEVENDRPWVASDIHSRISEMRRAEARLSELNSALRTLGVGR